MLYAKNLFVKSLIRFTFFFGEGAVLKLKGDNCSTAKVQLCAHANLSQITSLPEI